MKRDLDKHLFMPDRKTLMTYADTPDKLTMGMLLSEAAIGMYANEMIEAKEKSTRFRLSVRCAMGGVQQFTQSEIEMLRKVANLKCGTWLYGQVEAWLEGEDPFAEALIQSSDPADVAEASEKQAA